MKQYRELYVKTIAKWGEEAQIQQAIEECAELIVSLQHYARGKVGHDTVIHELADVYLMIGQLAYMFGEAELDAEIAKKITKLQGLIDHE